MFRKLAQYKDEIIALVQKNSGVYSNRALAERYNVSTSTMSNFVRENNLKAYMKPGVRGGSNMQGKKYLSNAKVKAQNKRMPFKRICNGVVQYCGAWNDIDIMLDAKNRAIKWVRKMTPDIFTDDDDTFVPVIAEVAL